MITYLDNDLNPHIIIEISLHHTFIPIDCIIDTGFNGYMLVVRDLAKYLTPHPTKSKTYITATGETAKHQIYNAEVRFGTKTRKAEVISTKGSHNLVGIQFLKDFVFTLDLGNRKISLS